MSVYSYQFFKVKHFHIFFLLILYFSEWDKVITGIFQKEVSNHQIRFHLLTFPTHSMEKLTHIKQLLLNLFHKEIFVKAFLTRLQVIYEQRGVLIIVLLFNSSFLTGFSIFIILCEGFFCALLETFITGSCRSNCDLYSEI